jgi:hypothetical protein
MLCLPLSVTSSCYDQLSVLLHFLYFCSALPMSTMQVAATCITWIYVNNDRHNRMDSIKLILISVFISYVTLLLCKCYTSVCMLRVQDVCMSLICGSLCVHTLKVSKKAVGPVQVTTPKMSEHRVKLFNHLYHERGPLAFTKNLM